MTTEEKQLLLIDLCQRLPYGVRVKIFDESILLVGNNEKGTLDGKETMSDDCFVIKCKNDSWIISCEDFKPYLRPMSSMTEEEIEECYQLQQDTIHVTFYKYDEGYEKTIDLPYFKSLVDFYNSHHLDYRGLIEEGLALEAPKGMYKTE